MSDYSKEVDAEWEKQSSENTKVNIMILGGTGVGKSALVNHVFGKNIAKEGSGKPITKGMDRYEFKDTPIVLFDTEGYEISERGINSNNFRNEILPKIDEYQKKELKEQIHLAWYCISISNNRITKFDIDNIKIIQGKLQNRMAIVFTQCDNDEEDKNGKGVKAEEFKRILSKEDISLDTFETSTNKELNLTLDFEKLMIYSTNILPNESLRESFIASQMYSLELKSKEALKCVKERSLLASGIGASPIPYSDTIALTALQVELSIKIAKIFGISSMGDNVTHLLKAQIVSMIGKTLVTQLLKFIPVLGSAANALVAGALTYGFGVGMLTVYEKVCKEYLESGKEPDWIALFSNDMFMNTIKEAMETYYNKNKGV